LSAYTTTSLFMFSLCTASPAPSWGSDDSSADDPTFPPPNASFNTILSTFSSATNEHRMVGWTRRFIDTFQSGSRRNTIQRKSKPMTYDVKTRYQINGGRKRGSHILSSKLVRFERSLTCPNIPSEKGFSPLFTNNLTPFNSNSTSSSSSPVISGGQARARHARQDCVRLSQFYAPLDLEGGGESVDE